MISLAQRITELRTEKGLSRPELSAALGLPKNAIEKFETGRQTPTQEQQAKLAAYFEVSLFYLRGESNDPTRQDDWMNGGFVDDEPAPAPSRRTAPRPAPISHGKDEGGSLLDPLMKNKAFQDMVRATVLDVLRSSEGQDLLAQAVRRQLREMK